MADNLYDSVLDPEERRLKTLGLSVIDPEKAPKLHAQAMHIARKIVQYERQVIGLWPVDDSIGIPSLALQIALALADYSSTTVSFIDANVRWPAGRAMLEEKEASLSENSSYFTFWLRGMVAFLLPKVIGGAGEGYAILKRTIAESRDLFGYILVDMTGFDYVGDHLSVMELLDGVTLVAAKAKTIEDDILELQQDIDPELMIGTILVG